MASQAEIPPKQVLETQRLQFDFISDLAEGETISTQSCACVVYSGTDASPSNVISGSATASGTVVTQLITGGTLGVIYTITCSITTSLGQTLKQSGQLAIVPANAGVPA